MLKLGFRYKQFHPFMLFTFDFLRKCLEILFNLHPYKDNISFLIMFLFFFSQSLIGLIIYFYYSKKRTKIKKHIGAIQLINKFYKKNDSKLKKFVLIIFASFFSFVGNTIPSNDVIKIWKKEETNSQLEVRVRSIQIIISSLACYYTIKIRFYKHQKFSMLFIVVFLIFILIMELIISPIIYIKVISLIICAVSCACRAFMDITEKYLFEYNYVNFLIMLVHEGNIGTLLYFIFFIFNKSYQNQAKNLLKNLNDISEYDWTLISLIIFTFFYIIIIGLRNAYRVTTNKYYSPMSRALIESSLDPFIFLYNSLSSNNERNLEFWSYFGFITSCLTIIAFFSLVYNDFIVLYCCGLERNTYSEITRRLYLDTIHVIKEFKDEEESQLIIDENGEVYSESTYV